MKSIKLYGNGSFLFENTVLFSFFECAGKLRIFILRRKGRSKIRPLHAALLAVFIELSVMKFVKLYGNGSFSY
jgi:hypothetical protein